VRCEVRGTRIEATKQKNPRASILGPEAERRQKLKQGEEDLRKRHVSRGFTLVELVLAIAIGLVLLGAVWTAVWSGQRSSVGIERKVTAGQDARMALEIMAAEIRMASFNPLTADGMWVNPSDCSVAVNQQWRGLQEATASSIAIEMDLDPDGICGNSGNEIIRYAHDPSSGRITRETIRCDSGSRTSSGGQPFLGPIPSNPAVRTARVINGGVPLFRYYDGTGVELVNLPADIHKIRRIGITLLVESADADPGTGQPRRMAYSTSVVPRNHGIRF
jgi:prepilin-type N-terminal cleavage/methylation domain-containing protein